MEEEIFKEIGFTNAETKVYLALLELGAATAGPVIRQTGLQNSVVHLTLRRLVENGYVSYVIKGKRKQYQAADPEHILKTLSERQRRFEEVLPELKLKREMSANFQEAEIYEGIDGFKNMIHEAVASGSKGDEWLFLGFDTDDEKFRHVYDFYKRLDKVRVEAGFNVRGIMKKGQEKQGEERIVDIKFADFPVLSNITVLKDRVLFTPFEEKPVSFMIKSQEMSRMFKEYFYDVWRKAK